MNFECLILTLIYSLITINGFVTTSKYPPSRSIIRFATGEIPENVRRKLENPEYDPFIDPEASEYIDSKIPVELLNFRKHLALATESHKALVDGSKEFEKPMETLKSLDVFSYVTSPQSKWFRNKCPKDVEVFDTKQLEELEAEVAKEFPEILNIQ